MQMVSQWNFLGVTFISTNYPEISSPRVDVVSGDELISARAAANYLEDFDYKNTFNWKNTSYEPNRLNIFFLFWGQVIAHDIGKLSLLRPKCKDFDIFSLKIFFLT